MVVVHIAAVDGQPAGGQLGRVGAAHGNALLVYGGNPAGGNHQQAPTHGAAVVGGRQVGAQLGSVCLCPAVYLILAGEVDIIALRVVYHAHALAAVGHAGGAKLCKGVGGRVIHGQHGRLHLIGFGVPSLCLIHHHGQQLAILVGGNLRHKLGLVFCGLTTRCHIVAEQLGRWPLGAVGAQHHVQAATVRQQLTGLLLIAFVAIFHV